MTIQQLFVLSNLELKKIIDQISPNQWSIQMPPGLISKPIDLKGAINYHVYDDAWVPDVLSGKTKEEVGDKYEYLLTAPNTKEEYSKYNPLANDAVEAFTNLEHIVHLSYGDYSAKEYLQHVTIFRSLRVYDIAKLIGADTNLKPDFLEALWDEYSPLADGYRQYGIFPAEIKVAEDATLQEKFLGLVGRE